VGDKTGEGLKQLQENSRVTAIATRFIHFQLHNISGQKAI